MENKTNFATSSGCPLGWTKIERLGRGSQGTTWLVKKDATDDTAALKELNYRTNKQARARMVSEVTSLKLLSERAQRIPKIIDDNTRNVLSSALSLALIFFVVTKDAKAQNDWNEAFPAFRIAGNLYYVGSKGL